MGKSFEALIQEFNAAHPNITIQPSYGGTLWTMRDKLLIAIAGKAAPDISQIDQFWAPELADANAVVKMADLIAADKSFDKTDVYDKAWETGTYKGEIWTMPLSFSNIVLYYNKKLFQEASLDPEKPPTTWDQLVTAGKALTKDTNKDGKTEQWGISFPLKADAGCVYYWIANLWQAGGDLFNADYTKSAFNDAAGVAAVQFWIDMVHKDKILPLAPPEKGFETGLVAMTWASSSQLATYVKALGTDNLGMAFMPKSKQQVTGVGGGNLAILATAKDKAAAWEFVRWMTSPEINLKWSTQTGYNPLLKSVVASAAYQEYLSKEPRARVIVDQMEFAKTRPNILAYADASREIGLAVESAVFGKQDPKATLDAAAVKVDEMLKK
jgi:multiple sugar transport system substrate-binding protein